MSEDHIKKGISELDAATSIESTDLFIISKLDNGDYVSRKVSFSDLAAEVAQHNHDDDYVSKYSSGWVSTDGSTTVANGATLTFTHGLGTTDLACHLYVSDSSSGTNAQSLIKSHPAGSSNMYDAVVTNITSTQVTVQFGALGYLNVSTAGQVFTTSFAGKFFKVIVIA